MTRATPRARRPAAWCAALAAAATAALPVGCARAPAGAGSGTRLVVTVRMAGPINPTYHYYLVIRNAGDAAGLNGPAPVFEPPYGGNGFATDKNPSSQTVAFTDLVQFSAVQAQATSSGYAVYHVPGGVQGAPEQPVYQARGEPVAAHTPSAGGQVLQFTLDLEQIAPGSGEVDPNDGRVPRYLQVNIIVTTTVPANAASIDPNYVVDAFGDQGSAFGSAASPFLTIDTSQARTYQSTDVTVNLQEPEGDPYPSDRDPGADMVYWSIQVLQPR